MTKESLLRGVEALCERDDDLAAVVERHGAPPLWLRRTGFATLARIILEQQVSLASAKAILRRVQVGLGKVSAHRVASHSPDHLRRLGLTRQKAAYVWNLADAVVRKEFDLRSVHVAPDEHARDLLISIKGVGPWTADIYLLMALGRPDVWPTGDLALATSMRRVKRLRETPATERQSRIASAWRPWRSVAARILWHAYLSER